VIYEIKEAKEYDYEKFNDLFRMVTYEFFVYFKKDIVNGENVNVSDVINVDFQLMFHELNSKVYKSITVSAYYKDEKRELFLYDNLNNKFMVYGCNGKRLCYCVFKDDEPYDGRSLIYKEGLMYFDGEITNGKLVSGTFYHCRINDDDSPVLGKDNYPINIKNFIKGKNYNPALSCRAANLLYDSKDYIVFQDTVETGFIL
jgi:hypothetical protein